MKTDTPPPADPSANPSEPDLDFHEFPPSTPDDWRQATEPFLKGAPFEKKLVTRTPEGIALQPIYFANQAQPLPASARPARFGRLIAQEIHASQPGDFNRTLLAALMAGQNCVPIPLSTSARRAKAPKGDVSGEPGLPIATLADLRAALDRVDLSAVPLLVWAGASALPFLGLLGALAEERSVRLADLHGGVLADPLTEWARDGDLDLGLSDAFDEMASALRWAETKAPRLRVIGIQAGLWADAGGTAVDELAFALATGTEYLREMTRRQVDIQAAAPRVQFGLSLDSQIFMHIAKLRAARQLWARIVTAFGGDATAAPICIHGRSSGFTRSSLDPHANLLRATGEAFAGIIGGVESMHIAGFDETLRTPDALSLRLARNTQLLLDEECGLADVADAAGGSWYIENLTREIAEKAWKRFQEIEAAGGMAAALREGTPQRAVTASGDARCAAVAAGRETLVGVNLSANPKEEPLPAGSHRASHAAAKSAQPDAPSQTSTHITDIPSAIEAFLSGWTLTQIQSALPRGAEAAPGVESVQTRRVAQGFETLRTRAKDWEKTTGKPPAAWLATFGPPRQHRARADFSSAFLACGGFDVRSGQSTTAVEDAVASAAASNAPVVVICSTDDTYPEIVPAFAGALKQRAPGVHLLLAGAPGDNEAAWREAGVDGFIHLRVNRLECLENLLSVINPQADRS